MAKFKPKFKALTTVRKHRLNVAKAELHTATSAEMGYREDLEALKSNSSSELFNEAVSVSGRGYLSQQRELKKQQICLNLDGAMDEVKRNIEWVNHLKKELKTVEKLHEKNLQQHIGKEKKREQKQLDSWVIEVWKGPNQIDEAES